MSFPTNPGRLTGKTKSRWYLSSDTFTHPSPGRNIKVRVLAIGAGGGGGGGGLTGTGDGNNGGTTSFGSLLTVLGGVGGGKATGTNPAPGGDGYSYGDDSEQGITQFLAAYAAKGGEGFNSIGNGGAGGIGAYNYTPQCGAGGGSGYIAAGEFEITDDVILTIGIGGVGGTAGTATGAGHYGMDGKDGSHGAIFVEWDE